MGFVDSSIYYKIATIVSGVGLLFCIIGYSTGNWFDAENERWTGSYGMWSWAVELAINPDKGKTSLSGKIPGTVKVEGRSLFDFKLSDAITLGRVFGMMGLFAGAACIALLLVYMFSIKNQLLKTLTLVAGIGSSILFLVGVIVMSVDVSIESSFTNVIISFGYSFWLAMVGGILYGVVGILLIVDIKLSVSRPE